MFGIVVNLIIVLLIIGFIGWLVTQLPALDPFRNIVYGLFILLAILAVLSAFGFIGGGLPHIRL